MPEKLSKPRKLTPQIQQKTEGGYVSDESVTQIDECILQQVLQQDIQEQPLADGKVLQSEICLFCNLKNIFHRYEQAQPENDLKQVIQPKQVRNALEKIFVGTLGGEAFEKGNMGCAQETLEYILDYLHREFVNPNYLEEFVKANKNTKF